jgi:hypothetical protein
MKKTVLFVAAMLVATSAMAESFQASAELSRASVEAGMKLLKGSITLSKAALNDSKAVTSSALTISGNLLQESAEQGDLAIRASAQGVSYVAGKVVDVTVSAGVATIKFVTSTGAFSIALSIKAGDKVSEATVWAFEKAKEMGTEVLVTLAAGSQEFSRDMGTLSQATANAIESAASKASEVTKSAAQKVSDATVSTAQASIALSRGASDEAEQMLIQTDKYLNELSQSMGN